MGLRRIGMIATIHVLGEQGVRDFTRTVTDGPERDLQLVDVERFNPTDVSVAAQAARLKAAAPQVIVGFAAGAPFGTIRARSTMRASSCRSTPARPTRRCRNSRSMRASYRRR